MSVISSLELFRISRAFLFQHLKYILNFKKNILDPTKPSFSIVSVHPTNDDSLGPSYTSAPS